MESGKHSGQSAMEFIMIFTLLIAALCVAAWVSLERTREMNAAKIQLEANNMLNDVSEKINTAFLEGSGFSVRLNLPEKLLGRDYLIQVYSNYVYLDFAGTTYVKQLLTKNITGSFVNGENTVRNKNGIIMIGNL